MRPVEVIARSPDPPAAGLPG